MLATKQKPQAESSEPDFFPAQARWNEVRDRDRELMERHEAMRAALSITSGYDVKNVSEGTFAKAQPYLKLGQRRREKLIDQLADIADEIADFKPKLMVESELWQAARRRETAVIAGKMQPAHKAAITAIAKALEALSIAIEEETATRKELARVAPERESSLLPNCSDDLMVGTLADWNSPASAWARRMRKLNILG